MNTRKDSKFKLREANDGGYYNQDDVYFKTKDDALLAALAMCDCVEAAPVLSFVRSVLCVIHQAYESPTYKREALDIMRANDAASFYITLTMLDVLEFIEHGSSIRSPWLTPKGEAYLSYLDEWATERKGVEGAQ